MAQTLKTIYNDRYQILIEKLIVARKNAKLTQADVAHLLHKPQSFIAKIEGKDRKLDVMEFIELCKILGISASKVLQDIE